MADTKPTPSFLGGSRGAATAAGATTGSMIAPGVGTVIGAVAGGVIDAIGIIMDYQTAKKNIAAQERANAIRQQIWGKEFTETKRQFNLGYGLQKKAQEWQIKDSEDTKKYNRVQNFTNSFMGIMAGNRQYRSDLLSALRAHGQNIYGG